MLGMLAATDSGKNLLNDATTAASGCGWPCLFLSAEQPEFMPDLPPVSDFAYDRVPYPGAADGLIQLRNLQVVASLFGLNPADIKKCRVLEIGCANGTNLLPFAVEFPDSTFVGVDLAASQIQQAVAVASRLNLPNAQFHAANVTDFQSLGIDGPFDYILVPGVFSWVTAAERQSLLQLLRRFLAPSGVAAVSFNVLPGWSFREPLREFIRRHVRAFAEPDRQIQEARQAVRFLAEASIHSTAHQKLYADVHQIFETASDHYIFHDYISDRNQPFYFHQFVNMIQEHELQFVAECDFCHTVGIGLNSLARTVVDQSPVLDREQLIDFVAGNAYRRALVCHESQTVTRRFNHSSMTGLHLALVQHFSSLPANLADTDPWQLDYPNGSLTTTEPLGKAALRLLNDVWPQTRTVDQLYSNARDILPADLCLPTTDSQFTSGRDVLAQSMLAAYAAGLIQVYKTPPNTARWPPGNVKGKIGEFTAAVQTASIRPVTSVLLRFQAEHGGRLVNLWHQHVGDLRPEERFVLSRLDGNRDLSVLAADVQTFCSQPSSPLSIVEATTLLTQILNRLSTARLLQEPSPDEFFA